MFTSKLPGSTGFAAAAADTLIASAYGGTKESSHRSYCFLCLGELDFRDDARS